MIFQYKRTSFFVEYLLGRATKRILRYRNYLFEISCWLVCLSFPDLEAMGIMIPLGALGPGAFCPNHPLLASLVFAHSH